MKEMFRNLTAMVSSLSTHMDKMEGGGRKKRKVRFRSRAQLLRYPCCLILPLLLPRIYLHLRVNLTAVRTDWP